MKKYSLILDKSSIKPDTQIFALRAKLFKCVLCSSKKKHMCRQLRQEKFLNILCLFH